MPPAERREQLLDAALRVIVAHGVHKVSIDSVAKEAGVTRPVAYVHFADSNELLRASLDREERRAIEQWSAALASADGDSVETIALSAFRNFLERVHESPDLWSAVFMLSDSSTPAFRSRLDQGRQLVVRTFEDLLGDVGSDRVLTIDVEVAARILLAVVWEAGRLLLADSEAYPIARLMSFAENAIAMIGPG
ncbi:TetR/AcrR family transcriptional regulator [Gordonia sp. (in: high G+C Gram-positive bacteria)]|uniref:TetR/AcrR family transcriptional regulator n=1 Tax=Gordonia sp. (in: high G+C Gram-positive bacteria) TaxID=84139 RepID=UPI003F9E687B